MQTQTFELTADTHRRLPGAERVQIHCQSGVLWLTRAGDAQDYLLAAGESLLLERSRGVVVGALRDAVVRLEPAQAAGPVRRPLSADAQGLLDFKRLRSAR